MYQQESPRLALNGINPRFNIGSYMDSKVVRFHGYREVRFLSYHKLNKLNNMSESKELLEATVKGLQEKIQSLQTDLNVKTKELNDVNKPKLNQSTMDIIYDCVTEGIEEFDFSDTENYDFEPELDYDRRVSIGSIDFNSADYIAEPIIKSIENKFNIINDTEDEDNK